jgi:capsular exopolysaccharide synthesis family protein
MPLLAQVPTADRWRAPTKRLATLTEPAGASTEAFRILKNNLEIAQLERHVGSIVMTSPLEVEGKSATAANLSVILARSGRHVILVDLDLRHPSIDRFFGLRDCPGLTNVAMGVDLADALSVVDVSTDRPGRAYTGMLEVLRAGPPPWLPPGDFLLSSFLPEALAALAERCDVLLIDTPPMLAVADAMVIARHSDAVILFAQVNQVRRETLVETRYVLDGCPALKLGVIAAGCPMERGTYLQRVRGALTGTNSEYPRWARASAALNRRRVVGRKRARAGHRDVQESAQQVPDA